MILIISCTWLILQTIRWIGIRATRIGIPVIIITIVTGLIVFFAGTFILLENMSIHDF